MAAAVLVLVVLGVLAALDSVSRTAGANKARTIAATLAEEDQERLRGMATANIDAEVFASEPVDVGGVEYTVTSRAEWVRDATGETVSCSAEDGQASYMKITSTVTSPATGGSVKPVVLSSIVAPRAGAAAQGTLAVRVQNAAGMPVMNLPVTATGPMTRAESTNEAGCAVFGLLDPGSYVVQLNTGGWVDKAGQSAPSQTATVTQGEVSTLEFTYDKASSLTVQVKTRLNGAWVDDPSTGVIAANTGVPPSGFRTFTHAFPGTTSFTLTGLFPFSDGYTVFSGACPGADPANYVPDYYSSYPGLVTLAPGVPGGTISVLEPAINLHVKRGGNNNDWDTGADHHGPSSRVVVYPTTADCPTGKLIDAELARPGVLPNPGLPFGTYDICVENRANRLRWARNVVNDDPAGTPVINIWLDTSSRGERGSCGP